MIFTTRTLEKLPPQPKEFTIPDPKTLGLYLRVMPNGRKTWLYRYTHNGKRTKKSLGKFPRIPVEGARKIVSDFQHTEHIDLTYGAIFDVYLKERNLRDSTKKDYRQKYTTYIKDTFGDVQISRITRADINTFYRELSVRSPAQANYAIRVIRAVINFAAARYRDGEDRPIITDNPTTIISETQSWKKLRRRKTVLRATEIKQFWDYWQDSDDLLGGRYHQLLLLTGMRGTALLTLSRAQVRDHGITFLNKNDDDTFIPLSDLAQGLLDEVLGSHMSEWVFPSVSHKQPAGEHYMRERRKTSTTDLGFSYTRHDLRRTFMTLADEIGLSQSMIKRLAGHRTQDVTEGYIITSSNTLLRATNQVSETIITLL